MIKRNIKINYLISALFNVLSLVITGGIIQSFLLENGVDARRVSVFVSAMQVSEVGAMVLLAPFFEKEENLFRLGSIFYLFMLPVTAAITVISLVRGFSVDARFWIMMATGFITYMGIGLASMNGYKLPYKIFDINDYGRICAVAGMITGVISIVSSAVLTRAIEAGDYHSTMAAVGVLCSFIILFCSWLWLKFREVDVNADRMQKTGRKIRLLSYRPFTLLILPNIFRGLGTGAFNLFTAVGYHMGLIDSVTAGLMVTLGNIAMFLTYFVYRRLALKRIDAELILVSSTALFLLMPMAFVGNNVKVFLIVYALAFFFKVMLEMLCPVAIVPIVDYEIMSQYTAWRVALCLLGIAVAGVITIPLIDRFGVILTMAGYGLLLFAGGLISLVVIRKLLKEKAESDANRE